MKVYKIIYLDGEIGPFDVFDLIDLVPKEKLVVFVQDMIENGRICDESIEIFKEKHPLGVQTEQDAIELLVLDGYTLGHQEL